MEQGAEAVGESVTSTKLLRVQRNTAVRDYIVGDIHGCFSALQKHLDAIGFNPDAGDRLFSVGDLVDRGPECEASLEWLAKPWFFAVAGNHEDYAIRWPKGNMDANNYIANGGAWNAFKSTDESWLFSQAFAALPVAIELETDAGLIGIVHADCPMASWTKFSKALETGWIDDGDGLVRLSKHRMREIVDAAQWSRGRIELSSIGFVQENISGVRAVVVGHTPLPEPEWVGNVLYIDTGACFEWGHFTVVDAETLEEVLP